MDQGDELLLHSEELREALKGDQLMELAAQPYGAPDVLFDRIDKLLYAQDSGAATEELMQAYVQWRQAKTAYEKEMRKKEKQK